MNLAIKAKSNVYSTEVVQEVVDGEETPLLKNKKRMNSISQASPDSSPKIKVVERPVREIAKPLFPLNEGSYNFETINARADNFTPGTALSTLQNSRSMPARSKLSAPATGYIRNKSFAQRVRKIEVDRSNKALLSNMLRIEKDLVSIKQKIALKEKDVGSFKPEHLCQTFQTSMLRPQHHTTMNRRREIEAINKENTRIYEKLRKQ